MLHTHSGNGTVHTRTHREALVREFRSFRSWRRNAQPLGIVVQIRMSTLLNDRHWDGWVRSLLRSVWVSDEWELARAVSTGCPVTWAGVLPATDCVAACVGRAVDKAKEREPVITALSLSLLELSGSSSTQAAWMTKNCQPESQIHQEKMR